MLKMVDGTGIIGVDMVCPLGVSTPQPPNYDRVEMEGVGSLMLPNSLKAPIEMVELIGNSVQGENPAPDNPQEIKSVGKEVKGKYLLDLKITGKNLFNLTDNYIWGWFASYQTQIALYSFNAVVYMPCKPNTTYTIYGRTNVNGNNNVKNRVATANDFPAGGTKLYNIAEAQLSNPVTITTDELSKYLVIMAVTDNECNIDTREQVLKQNVSKMMVIIGNTPTPYEPHTEQSVQIALNEPLRGIGEYKDTITKDGVVRKIKRIMFDENTPFKEYNAPVQVKTTSFISGTTIKDATGETGIEVMSDRFKAKDRGFDRYDEECITLFGKCIFVRFNKDKNINTAEALTEWLKQNPLTVDYVLAEPVTEPLSESVQALHSENGTTHVFVDSGEVPCGIKLTYRKEK